LDAAPATHQDMPELRLGLRSMRSPERLARMVELFVEIADAGHVSDVEQREVVCSAKADFVGPYVST
jgi:hypothetical protein